MLGGAASTQSLDAVIKYFALNRARTQISGVSSKVSQAVTYCGWFLVIPVRDLLVWLAFVQVRSVAFEFIIHIYELS